MPVSLDATIGGATTNSYLLLAEAQTIIDSWIPTEEITQWAIASVDTQNRALVSAFERLDREAFFGDRASATQSAQWPRYRVAKPDLYSSPTRYRRFYQHFGSYYSVTEIPIEVKKAQVVIALYLNSNPSSLGLGGLEQFRKVKVGPLEVEPVQPQDLRQLPPMVEQYLRGLKAGSSSISILRG